jgi:ABC-type proline/glycine betaine transport system permease subunit
MSLVEVVFGWPAIIAALALLGLGIATRRWRVVLVGCLVDLPFLVYLFATPRFRYLAPVLLLLNFGSAVAIGRGYRWLASLMLLPLIGTVVWMAYAVLTQGP